MFQPAIAAIWAEDVAMFFLCAIAAIFTETIRRYYASPTRRCIL